MIDYRGLEALAAILENNSFEVAADKLFITQSAISQRLKTLQNYYGDPLITRGTPGTPYLPTTLGELLITHYKKVNMLEDSLQSVIDKSEIGNKFGIAINRDSLETWFLQILLETKDNKFLTKYQIEIITCDQEYTLDFLKNGMVSICFSTKKEPIANCKSELIGYMDYVLVCNQKFKKKYFPNKIDKETLLKAPALKYDRSDELYNNYLKKYFDLHEQSPNYHTLPSVKGFKEAVLQGHVCTLIPELDVRQELKNKILVNLLPNKIWRMPFYLHSWQLGSQNYEEFISELSSASKSILAT